MDAAELAKLGLEIDDTGALRALDNFEKEALKTAKTIVASSKATSDAFGDNWTSAMRKQYAEIRKWATTIIREQAKAQGGGSAFDDSNARRNAVANNATLQYQKRGARELAEVRRELGRMEARDAREVEAQVREAARAKIAAEREVSAVTRQRIKEEEALARGLLKLEKQSDQERAAETAAYARQRQEMDRAVAATAQQTAKQDAEAARLATREKEAFAREYARAHEQAIAEDARYTAQQAREIADVHRALGKMEQRDAREAALATRETLRARRVADREIEKSASQRARSEVQAQRDAARAARDREREEREAARNVNDAWQSAKRFIMMATAGLGVREIIEYADSWTLLNARISLVTNSSEQQFAVMQKVFGIAQNTRSDLESTATLYVRLARATQEFGNSQADVLRVTELVNKALIIGGATTREAAATVLQFAHALSEDRLQGRQLNSLLMNAPRLLEAIRVGAGVSSREMRDLSRQGELTTEMLVRSLLSQGEAIDNEFGRIPRTFGQAMVQLKNNFMFFMGVINNATHGTELLGKAIDVVRHNLPLIAAAVVALTTAWVVYNVVTTAVIVKTAILASIKTIAAFIELAKAVSSVADAMALLELASGGVVAALALIAGLALGYVAYTKMKERMAAATRDATAAALAELRGQNKLKESNDELTKSEERRIAANARARMAAQQAIVLASMEGEAQERLRVHYEAVNREVEARLQHKMDPRVLADTLRTIAEEESLKQQEITVRHAYELAKAREENTRLQRQALELTRMQGDELEAQRIQNEAINKVIEARRTLIGENLADAIAQIEQERVSNLVVAMQNEVQEFANTFQQVMSQAFANIFQNGIKSFADLFDGIRQMLFRMIADVVARRFMETIGRNIGKVLANLFSSQTQFVEMMSNSVNTAANRTPAGRAALNLSHAADALIAAAAALDAAARHMQGLPAVPAPGTPSAPPAQLPPITGTGMMKSMLREIVKYIGPALAGLSAGVAFGGMTSNRGLGALGGAASGAASGAMIGSVIPGVGTVAGAIVGGITGALGGIFGSSARRRKEQEARNEILAKNNQRLGDLKQALEGELLSGRNLSSALSAMTGIAKNGKNMESQAQKFGLTLMQLQKIAQQTGIELYDSAGKIIPAALKQFEEALKLTIYAMTHYTNSLQDMKSRQEAYNKLFNKEDTPINKLTDAQSILEKMAPELMKQMGLSNLNLNSAAARQVFLKGLQDIFKLVDSGMLTPELLGSFTDKNELIDAILAAKDGLDAFNQSLSKVTTDFPKAMDLLIFEQRHGTLLKNAAGAPAGARLPQEARQESGVVIHGDVYITTSSDESGDAFLQRLEEGTRLRSARGGFTSLRGVEIAG